jgi:hypothetical protein
MLANHLRRRRAEELMLKRANAEFRGMNRWLHVALLAWMMGGPASFAQSQSAGQVELAGFAGGSYLRAEGEGHTKGAFGGRAGVAASSRILAFGEFSFYPLGNITAIRELRECPPDACVTAPPITFRATHVTGHLWDFSGGVHVNLTSGDSKAAPYVLGTLGAGRVSGEGSFSVSAGPMTNQLRIKASDTALVIGGGGGLRYYVGQTWGFQPEVRYTRYFFEDAGLNNLRFTLGLFYRFGG